MLPASLLILLDASKKALEDLTADDISGWSHVKHVVENTWSLKVLSWSRRNSCFARPLKWFSFGRVITAYDTLVNYYDCHEETLMMIKHLDIPKGVQDDFHHAIETSRKAAIKIIRKDISAIFPDLVHSINQRRAQYFMLNQKIIFTNEEN